MLFALSLSKTPTILQAAPVILHFHLSLSEHSQLLILQETVSTCWDMCFEKS